MRLVPKSLRGRLLLVILAALAVAQLLILWFFAGERSLAVQTALAQEAAARAANVAQLLEASPPEQAPVILAAANSPLVRFSLDDKPEVDHPEHANPFIAARLARYLGRKPGPDVRVEVHERLGLGNGGRRWTRDVSEEMRRMHRAMMGTTRVAAVRMEVSIRLGSGDWLNVETRFHRPPVQWAFPAVVTFFVSAAVIALAVWVALGRLTGPLRALADAATRFGRGEPVASVPVSGPEELQRLTRAFNEMQDRIRRFVEERTQLLAALGHDLRSPLTALRVRAEMVDDEETRERLVASIEEMQQMVEATLSFARGMADSEPAETVDLGEYVGALCAEMAEAGEDVTFVAAPGPVSARLRPAATRRALRNVIGNAVRYGGRARVAVRADGVVVVEDDGPGIPEADLSRVFDPFVRLERSRSRETGGTGLGLSIARSILTAQGGGITLENRAEGGLRVLMRLPR